MITLTSAFRALVSVAMLALTGTVSAQTYPSRPIQLIVPFSAGGPTDVYARLIGKSLGDALGQPVIVDNRPGATGLIGTKAVKDAPPDGYTLLYTSNSAHVIGPLLRKPQSFDPVLDFTPITEPLRYPMYLLTSTKLPAKTFKEFVALAKSQPGKLTYASVGTGSGSHLACELMNRAAGIQALHVPYKGAAQTGTALMSAEVDFMCDSVGNSQPMVRAGKMNGLALTSAKRLPAVPNIPTMTEQGVAVEAYIWHGVFGPKGLPADVRKKLAVAIRSVMNSPELNARMHKEGYELVNQSPEQFAKDITSEKAVWAKLIAEKNITAD
ncbi:MULTISPECIES: Bug family tripartite tricarboxylate transporter substrate binding protein [Cupriavidus]|uniref:Tripartite-type tricarboxylate transporter receptor subunit TctC n=1 Tax=Cupriavidus alkaliphilus TaxID=942866 RepID=A0A7W4VF20_9BURK|nr:MULTISPECIES: tripartite tricarboxylate transporter substrate binding protein [Cupriavidus]MBB3009923.1 tripartite-type tricarboxylate transporter receptor subunit TctC [Cupriavidus alkaliphilus]GLC97774.1 MFS transporter [Cupriavidus sp. TA19]